MKESFLHTTSLLESIVSCDGQTEEASFDDDDMEIINQWLFSLHNAKHYHASTFSNFNQDDHLQISLVMCIASNIAMLVVITKDSVATTTLNHRYKLHNIQDSPNTLHIHVHAAPPYCASSTMCRPDQTRPRKVKGHHGYTGSQSCCHPLSKVKLYLSVVVIPYI